MGCVNTANLKMFKLDGVTQFVTDPPRAKPTPLVAFCNLSICQLPNCNYSDMGTFY